jgi:hypothetical protein
MGQSADSRRSESAPSEYKRGTVLLATCCYPATDGAGRATASASGASLEDNTQWIRRRVCGRRGKPESRLRLGARR